MSALSQIFLFLFIFFLFFCGAAILYNRWSESQNPKQNTNRVQCGCGCERITKKECDDCGQESTECTDCHEIVTSCGCSCSDCKAQQSCYSPENECCSTEVDCCSPVNECCSTEAEHFPPVRKCRQPKCTRPRKALCQTQRQKPCPKPSRNQCQKPCRKSRPQPCQHSFTQPCAKPCQKPRQQPCQQPYSQPCQQSNSKPCPKPCQPINNCHTCGCNGCQQSSITSVWDLCKQACVTIKNKCLQQFPASKCTNHSSGCCQCQCRQQSACCQQTVQSLPIACHIPCQPKEQHCTQKLVCPELNELSTKDLEGMLDQQIPGFFSLPIRDRSYDRSAETKRNYRGIFFNGHPEDCRCYKCRQTQRAYRAKRRLVNRTEQCAIPRSAVMSKALQMCV